MPREFIQPKGLRLAPTYTPTVKAGNTVYIAGMTAVNENGEVVGRGDPATQTRQVLDNMRVALQAAGADFGNVVKLTVYITDPRFREPVGQVRSEYFSDPKPASTLIVCAGLADSAYLVEIEAIAVVD
jgi:enamine deaminase RidA (YjgF/YER057c/UK114 family)